MGVEAAKILTKTHLVVFIYSLFNKDLKKMLDENPEIISLGIPYAAKKFQILRNLLSLNIYDEIAKIFNKYSCDLCLLIQGNIDTSFIPALYCRRNKIKIVSYIPLAHKLRKISKYPILGYVKDLIQKYYYNIPDAFITVTQTQKKFIQERVGNKNIYVVENGINIDNYKFIDKSVAKKEIGLPENKFVLGYVGRFEKWHKGLDYFLKFLNNYAKQNGDIVILFVGKGPLEYEIKKIQARYSNIYHVGWSKNLSILYSAIDTIIFTSRFEGFPLTLLEANLYNIPIIASNITEFEEYLPQENLFTKENFDSIQIQLNRAKANRLNLNTQIPRTTIQDFQINFNSAIESIISDSAT